MSDIERTLTEHGALRVFDPPDAAAGRLRLVAARAGTGKTALLVQVAIDALLRGLPVLHLGLAGDTLAHVRSWYAGVYRDLTAGLPADEARAVWDRIEPRRLLMLFKSGTFTVERFLDRVRLLEAQGVFSPRVVVADGFALGERLRPDVEALARFAEERALEFWLAGRAARESDDLAAVVASLAGPCDTILVLEPEDDAVALRVVRGPAPAAAAALRLDPGTLLVRRT
ncbi:MAG: hypothetical protein GYA57_08585 [Myxococcales bacterium]|nr:hypothetical protein [Myxococcales bacterium]